MGARTIVAMILLVAGILGIAYGGFTFTHREKVVDVGPIHASADKHDWVAIPPIFGAVALAGGVVLLITGRGE